VEVTANDTIGDALKLLYKQRVLGAPVRDPHRLDSAPLTDRYVGLIDFASMVLWALEVLHQIQIESISLLSFVQVCYLWLLFKMAQKNCQGTKLLSSTETPFSVFSISGTGYTKEL